MGSLNSKSRFSKLRLFVIVAILVVVGTLIIFQFKDSFFGHRITSSEMGSSKVLEVNGNKVLVQGLINNIPGEMRDVVTIEFTINSDTKFIREEILLSSENEGRYKPEIRESEGTLSDLKPKTFISRIKASRNLVGKSKATAMEIKYFKAIFPEPSP